jgi:opacity protein-like surface antigen
LISSGVADAQDWRLSSGSAYLLPVAGLNNRFNPTVAFAVGLGKQPEDRWFWGGRVEIIRFTDENTDKLFVKNLQMKLEIYGGAVEAHYTLAAAHHSLRPYLAGSAGVYRWLSTRGAYQDNEVTLSEFKQKDWSWGFGAGIGLDYKIFRPLTLMGEMRYQMIVGELWPALAVRLENVSTFQWLSLNAGMRFIF